MCTRAQSARSLTRTQMLAARDLLWCRQCDLVSWVRDLHCAVRRCCFGAGHRLALTSCGPRGRRRGVSTPNQKSFSPLRLRPAGEMGHPYFSVVVSQCQSLSLHLPMSLGFFPPVSSCVFSLSLLSLSPLSCLPLFLLQTLHSLTLTSAPFSRLPSPLLPNFWFEHSPSSAFHSFAITPPNGKIMLLKFGRLSVSLSYSHGKRDFPLTGSEMFSQKEGGGIWLHLILFSTFPTLADDFTVILPITAVPCLGDPNLQ